MLEEIKRLYAQKAKDDQNAPKGWRWLALIPVVITVVAALVFIPQFRAHQREQHLLEQGQPAVAEIISIRETGNLYNKNPEVEIELRVQPPDAAAFSLEVTKVLEPTELAKYVQGSLVDVRYDPAQPDDVALVGLAKPTAPPAAEPPK